MKRLILFASFFLAAITGLAGVSHAAIIASQPDTSGSLNLNTNCDFPNFIDITAASNLASGTTYYFYAFATASSSGGSDESDLWYVNTQPINADVWTAQNGATSTNIADLAGQWAYISRTYHGEGGYAGEIWFASQYCSQPSDYTTFKASATSSLAFYLTDTPDLFPGGASISWIFPTDGTTTGSFYYWELGTSNVDLSTTSIVIVASAWNSTSSLSFDNPSDDGAIFNSASSTQQIPAHLSPQPYPTSTYYAEAGLFYRGNSEPYATTSIIGFSFDYSATSTQNPNGSIPISNPVPLPSSENCQYTSSSFFEDPVGSIREGVCASLTFLFIPNTTEQADLSNRFNAIGTSVANKPPFGYYTSAAAAFSTLSNSTTSTSTIIDATTTSNLYDVTQPLDEGLSLIISFFFLLWVYNRGRHFQPV